MTPEAFCAPLWVRTRNRLPAHHDLSRHEAHGCDDEALVDHLEGLFRDGMTWRNGGKAWHVDHVRPLWSFDLLDCEQALVALNWRNLQPLLVSEHIAKSARESRERNAIRLKDYLYRFEIERAEKIAEEAEEFRQMTGLTPAEYAAADVERRHHRARNLRAHQAANDDRFAEARAEMAKWI